MAKTPPYLTEFADADADQALTLIQRIGEDIPWSAVAGHCLDDLLERHGAALASTELLMLAQRCYSEMHAPDAISAHLGLYLLQIFRSDPDYGKEYVPAFIRYEADRAAMTESLACALARTPALTPSVVQAVEQSLVKLRYLDSDHYKAAKLRRAQEDHFFLALCAALDNGELQRAREMAFDPQHLSLLTQRVLMDSINTNSIDKQFSKKKYSLALDYIRYYLDVIEYKQHHGDMQAPDPLHEDAQATAHDSTLYALVISALPVLPHCKDSQEPLVKRLITLATDLPFDAHASPAMAYHLARYYALEKDSASMLEHLALSFSREVFRQRCREDEAFKAYWGDARFLALSCP